MKGSIQTQWNKAAEAWVDFVRTGKDYYRDELNNPAMFEILGNIRNKRILDVGCGEGYNTRIMARKGATVVGVDFSEEMIDLAIQKEKKDHLGIGYHVADACNLRLFKDGTFDIATCFMALQDIEHYQEAVKEVWRVLKKGGRFVFVIPHPCFERRIMGNTIVGGWEYEEDDSTPKYCKTDRYFDVHSYTISWTMDRLAHHFTTTSFHRTLTDYADALHQAGFFISRLKEPKPTKKGIEQYPMKETLRVPQSIVIEAVRLSI